MRRILELVTRTWKKRHLLIFLSAGTDNFKASPSSTDINITESYQDQPSATPSQLIPPTPSKKLTPKKYGFFSTTAKMDGMNTAGYPMYDLLRAGSLGNLDDASPTLEGESDYEKFFAASKANWEFSQGSPMEAASEPADGQGKISKMRDKDSQHPVDDARSDADGDVEDNATEDGTGQDPKFVEGRITKSANSLPAVRKNKFLSPAAPPIGGYSTRHQDKMAKAKKEKEKLASRRVTRANVANTKAAELKASNRSTMTARAATLHKKAKKRIAKGDAVARNTRAKSVLRNWRGEKIEQECGFVLVTTDEERVEEYVRF